MILRQFHEPSLGHASYLIGAEATGEALVLDVRRDVDGYFQAAHKEGLRIAYAADTHQHNDYVTGICELPARGDIQLLASARAELGYPVRPLGDNETLRMGEVEFRILHTPGHTLEHISLLVTDRSRGEEPVALFSGGALLAGDVARPDLLGGPEEARRHAEELCRTLQDKILTLPDHVQVYPTHVAGSLCAATIDSRLSTTIGYERRMNRMLAALADQDGFVRQCLNLEGLPAVPPYWARMRRMNRQGPPLLGALPYPPALPPGEFDRRRRAGALVLDARSAEAFNSHIPGALNVPLSTSFPTWAGTVLPPDAEVLLVLEQPEELWPVCWHLLRVGYPMPQGWLAGGMFAWRTAGLPLDTLEQWSVWELDQRRQADHSLVVLDVRQPREWQAGRIPGATWITGAELPNRIDEVPKDRPIAVVCGSGYRSSVAASLLRAYGRREVANVLGGMSGWKAAGLEVDKG